MNVIQRCLALIALAVLGGGCTPGTSTFGDSISFHRASGRMTVRINNAPITEGSGNPAEDKRTIAPFRGVDARHGIEVRIIEGDDYSVTVSADDNLLPLVETMVDGETLFVRVAGSLSTRNPIRVTVTTRQLSSVTAASSATVHATRLHDAQPRVDSSSSGEITIEEVQGDELAVEANSSGQVSLPNVVGKSLRVEVRSSGRVTAAGDIEDQHVAVSSSGSYDAKALASRSAQVDCSSSGAVFVNASESISGSVSSSGRVKYAGSPAQVSVKTRSSGSVSKMELEAEESLP